MSDRLAIKLWLIQRFSGMLLGLFVLLHLATMIYAIQGGLTADEILGRTKDNWLMAGWYSVFVITAAVHGSIGLRTVAQEVIGWRTTSLDWFIGLFCILLSGVGLLAVMGLLL